MTLYPCLTQWWAGPSYIRWSRRLWLVEKPVLELDGTFIIAVTAQPKTAAKSEFSFKLSVYIQCLCKWWQIIVLCGIMPSSQKASLRCTSSLCPPSHCVGSASQHTLYTLPVIVRNRLEEHTLFQCCHVTRRPTIRRCDVRWNGGECCVQGFGKIIE